ncbi:bifunctional phosphopantothenoylcysteine decarboxylase/phosphopantothenate synthase [Bifidobacterium sp. MA2]|uniref:Coenzyme A biosynthesis bifunctional protein CoaBC n=1 Tax=Bifidobacterium santillanense TaxID=2809028 RepID=A0ABS5UNE3_9BIFI|nr:bifunctional phosphopantothenoylcysteine decarboxylase/phosphopantothenate synthase [Bifidobacterium santillanense]MBT1172382.1 bifunctional phosphopantothenoylcysteine decarboxylase/phosphopantothenate synthase [Bifidobacterium santillanense]
MAHILLGVTGSIAAFKSCHLASDWTKAGHTVRVVETAAAERFVTPLTFTSLTGERTRTTMFPGSPASDALGDVAANPTARETINHVRDAAWADVLVVAPASADAIARIAAGLADDTLTSTILAYEGPKALCPAMNVHMYDNPATQRNLRVCRELGWRIVEPGEGSLACGDVGRGRMSEPVEIERVVEELLRGAAHKAETDGADDDTTQGIAIRAKGEAAPAEDAGAGAGAAATSREPADPATASQPLRGLNVLVTAGPTQEPLDPVRYLTNHSTGKMGYALAASAAELGAHVTLVSGPVALAAPDGVDVVHVTTAQDMFEAVSDAFAAADITVMAAAVGDFRVEEVSPEKIKKEGRESITLRLVSNPDILAWAGGRKRDDGSQVLCGFAMETENLIRNAARKLASKHCDMLVANNLREEGAGFATDTNVVTVLTPGTSDLSTPQIERWSKMDKTVLAKRLMLRLAAMRG